jgi:hypothetical protein
MAQLVRYVNSKGRSMDLSSNFNVRIKKKTAGFYNYEYTPDVTQLAMGVRVNRFTKGAAQYEMTIDFSGSREERADNLQAFFEMADYDVAMNKPGRLYVGDQYADGFIVKSEVERYDDRYRTIGKKCTFYLPHPYWIEDKTIKYKAIDGQTGGGIEFPIGFPFDLGRTSSGKSTVNNTHYIPTSFLLTFYGPCVNPLITIGGNVYKVNTTVASGEYLEIDSINKTVRRKTSSGFANEYNNREKSQSIFEPIQPGVNTLIWSGAFSFDLTLHQERSELKWT